jgi:hypothetical protein
MFDPRILYMPPDQRPKAQPQPYHRPRISRLSPGQPETSEHQAVGTRMTEKYRSDSTYRIRTRRSRVA